MVRHLIWAVAAVATISVITYYTAQYNIEEAKQRGFVGKACADAGGQWKKSGWTWSWECTRG